MLYKNFKVITEITNRAIRLALATLDMKSEDAARLTGAYPECFSESDKHDAITLSLLLDAHHEQCTGNPAEWDNQDVYLVTHKVIGKGKRGIFDLPVYEFAYCQEHLEMLQKDKDEYPDITIFGIIPDEIGTDVKFGTIIEYKGNKFFVIENNSRYGELGTICCVPEECIKIDCKIPQ